MATRKIVDDAKETKTKVEPVEDIEEVDIEPVKSAKKKSFHDEDPILCHSVTAGGLNITCRSGNAYEFNDYGRENEIDYRDLTALVRKGSDHIFMPRIIIDDADFLNEFPQVKRLYEQLYTSRDLMDILDLPEAQMEEAINQLPIGAKDTLKSLIATQIANGRIDSIRKVRKLTEIYDSDFNLLSELFGK